MRRRPNIVFICSDQHSGPVLMGGPGDVVPVRTPNLKRLASMGVHFKNAYCVDPVCAAAWASLMTGRFASDVGSYSNSTPFDGRVPSCGNYLQQAGYFCWATGKMDLTSKADLGFKQVHTSHGPQRRKESLEIYVPELQTYALLAIYPSGKSEVPNGLR